MTGQREIKSSDVKMNKIFEDRGDGETMARGFPILFVYEFEGETHKLICQRQGNTVTVYIDDEAVTHFEKKSFCFNSENIFNYDGHEYCLFFYSQHLHLINASAMLVIDGEFMGKDIDGKYRGGKIKHKYAYMPEKDPMTIVIAIIDIIAYIAAIVLYPPYRDSDFFLLDTARVFIGLYFMSSLIGWYRYPMVGISKRVKYSFKEKISGYSVAIVARLWPLLYVGMLSFAGIWTALSK